MKTPISILCLSIITLLLFFGCKKGADDPLISLRTRKARVVGNWTLKSGTRVFAYTSPGYHYIQDYTLYNDRYDLTESETQNDTTKTTVSSKPYELKMEFKKDGSVLITEKRDSYAYIVNGQWNFTKGVGELKAKEEIIINTIHTENQFSGSTTNQAGTEMYGRFTIKELRNKKMVLLFDSSQDDGGMTKSSVQGVYRMEQN
jgi:hypothetical protein